jgi:hypothetical protein
MSLDRNGIWVHIAPVLFGGSAFFLAREIRSAEPAESRFGETGRVRLKVTNVAPPRPYMPYMITLRRFAQGAFLLRERVWHQSTAGASVAKRSSTT